MKNGFLFCSILLTLVTSCKQEKLPNYNTENNKTEISKKITQQQKLELLLQSILNIKSLNKSIKLVNDKTDLELYLVKHDSFGITPDLSLEKYGRRIKFIDYEEAKRDSILNVIYFEDFDLKGDTAKVKYFHIIRGLGGKATLMYSNNKWQKLTSEFWYN